MNWAAVAVQLRAGGHDAVAVTERPELRAWLDPDLFAVAQAQRRALAQQFPDDEATSRRHWR
jgi:hypothetical protein